MNRLELRQKYQYLVLKLKMNAIHTVGNIEIAGLNDRLIYQIHLINQLSKLRIIAINKVVVETIVHKIYQDLLEELQGDQQRKIKQDSLNLIYDFERQLFGSPVVFNCHFKDRKMIDFLKTQELLESLFKTGFSLEKGKKLLIKGISYRVIGDFGFRSGLWLFNEFDCSTIIRLKDLLPLNIEKDLIQIESMRVNK